MFAFDDVKENYTSLDRCINASRETDLCPVSQLIRGHPKEKSVHLRPVAFVRFNQRRGKAKTVTIKALLDSGGAESLVTETHAKKLKLRETATPKNWSTVAGDLTTSQKCKTQFTLPELHEDRTVEWDFHVTKNLGGK